MKRWRTGCAALCAVLLTLTGCAPREAARDFFAMDTFMRVETFADSQQQADQLANEVESLLNGLDRVLSRTRTDSDLYRLNHADGAETEVDPETYAAIEAAVQYAEATGGAYDPTLAPLTDLWGIGTENARRPAQEEIDEALAHTGWEQVVLLGDNRVRLDGGVQLDLGGIGKGYAGDQASALLAQEGREASALLQLSGNIVTFGANPRQKSGDWVIGVADPDNTASWLGTVAVQGEHVVTSGDYERYFEENGVRYHHIFDPETGYPADSGLRSVTVVDESGTRADALTTALFVMGEEAGLDWCAQNDVDAVFVTADRRVRVTAGLESRFTFTGEEAGYTYESGT